MKWFEILLMICIGLLVACSPEPQEITYNQDKCDHCLMQISDTRYGAELVTNKAKVYKFDAIECMAAYIVEQQPGSDDTHSLWVIAFDQPGTLISTTSAFFVKSPALRSPMGLNLTSFSSEAAAKQHVKTDDDTLLEWVAVKKYVEQKW